eukprot:gnl/TRDRNA2_/TRDRNA2_175812_c2_seq4.p1 gnl/TRDRNA2_/TRDRNA2_175812_c2~~gnl/TRDRNA2_/TRDRNA2_175812_c2_seq4.p1  ORF type:complete len:558 (+),score=182.27 gnl/TRDRNA2_/TRDRNA2_175812_c2_seq4:70-1743(+)
MQLSMKIVLVALTLIASPTLTSGQTAMSKVVGLITELKAKVEADGKAQQKSYDKYACWCEKTLERKAADISEAKTGIEEMQKTITETKGEIGARTAEIAQLKKDIAGNKAAQKEATEMRQKENGEYDAERTESEQCIGALEAAIGVLTGAGEGKKFLQTFQEAQLLSVVGGVKKALHQEVVTNTISEDDMAVMKNFLSKPQEFLQRSAKGMSAAQVAANPFGDYAPQSTQIQGILKGMYDAFTADLEKDNVDEANAQKSYEEVMATKKQELATLEATLEKQTKDHAEAEDLLAKTKSNLDSTKEQLDADEIFFEDTKKACKTKAQDWATVTRLRTQEIEGMQKAIEILNSPEAQKTFTASTSTFLQFSAARTSNRDTASRTHSKAMSRSTAYLQLAKLSSKHHSMGLAQLAIMAKSTGHFDVVIASVDKMIDNLRKEEQADIEHKDRCEAAQTENKQLMADLKHEMEKTDEKIARMGDDVEAMKKEIQVCEAQIDEIETDMKEMLEERNAEHKLFVKQLDDDTKAKVLIDKAIEALSEFYKKKQAPSGTPAGKSQPT